MENALTVEGAFSDILNKLNEGLLAVDGELRIVYANDAALAMAGCAREQALGQPLAAAFPFISSSDLSPLFPASLADGALPAYFTNAILRNQSAGNRVVDCCAARLEDSLGGGYVLLLRDTADAKRLSALLRFRELCNPLTGLNKGAVFLDLLQQALDTPRSGGTRALLYLDIDFFQSVRNTGGSEAAQSLLSQAADLLRKTAGAQDTLSHIKQDDFAALVSSASREQASALGKRLLEAFRRHKFAYNGKNWTLTVSIGARLLGESDRYAKAALAASHAAAREAYRRGGNRLVFAAAQSKRAK